MKQAKQNKLRQRFNHLKHQHCPVLLLEELPAIPNRKFRFDYANVEAKVAIELNGGTWVNGRHNRASSITKEYEKNNLSAYYGWTVFYLSTDMITPEWLTRIHQTILQKTDVLYPVLNYTLSTSALTQFWLELNPLRLTTLTRLYDWYNNAYLKKATKLLNEHYEDNYSIIEFKTKKRKSTKKKKKS